VIEWPSEPVQAPLPLAPTLLFASSYTSIGVLFLCCRSLIYPSGWFRLRCRLSGLAMQQVGAFSLLPPQLNHGKKIITVTQTSHLSKFEGPTWLAATTPSHQATQRGVRVAAVPCGEASPYLSNVPICLDIPVEILHQRHIQAQLRGTAIREMSEFQ